MNQPVVGARSPYPNYLVWSIIITVIAFCACCGVGAIPGVVSIVYGTQVDSKFAAGDEAGAALASSNARTWAWVCTALVGLAVVMQVLSLFVEGMASGVDMILDQARQWR
ncbi:CD225/dispanin family protein [Lysobacter sp. BMK333-48F3]|uniref:CD225/dispanin family protein n=1 Tax=Lysobacter sp. BMK333-48F3 TaxID=2867962 RepID=UPI001C8BAD8C|nr:CD225/dispanin family protein [Lysobacter sp. BMK333-48F3]MBX9401679.1 CD225/dispanin family protein [Lysobacter sp. BMK333-48F3]